jgi:serine/threonine-protein kinase RIO1
VLISDNGVSRVWRRDGLVHKRQPKYLTDNEIYALHHLYDTGYVPFAEQTAIDTVAMEDLGKSEPVTNSGAFMQHRAKILRMLEKKGLRHGDLTTYSIIVKNNKPMLIDWGESRTWNDPRPDKRREGDKYWLSKTMASLCP